jgi:hypothetical protein
MSELYRMVGPSIR